MVEKDSDSSRTLLTIVNYEVYQDLTDSDKDTNEDSIKDSIKDTPKDTDKPQTINKELKNIKNERNNNNMSEIAKDIIDYLNFSIGSNYRHTSAKTKTLINARLNDGFTVDDFKTVIDKKYEEWKGTSMEQYLRPETLFGTKFEGYLNQKVVKQTSNNAVMDAIKNRVDIVDEWV